MARKQLNPSVASQPAPLPVPVATSSSNWKDHPLAVAAIAVAATIALCILLVKEVVLPTQTAILANQISELPAIQKGKSDAEAKVASLEKQLAEAQRILLETQHSNLFPISSPYPTGLGRVRLGDQITKVTETYAEYPVNRDEESYWTVNLQNSPFQQVAYYFDPQSAQKKVRRILFFFGSPIDNLARDVLKNKLTETIGTPTFSSKTKVYSWRVPPRIVVELDRNISAYSLYEN